MSHHREKEMQGTSFRPSRLNPSTVPVPGGHHCGGIWFSRKSHRALRLTAEPANLKLKLSRQQNVIAVQVLDEKLTDAPPTFPLLSRALARCSIDE